MVSRFNRIVPILRVFGAENLYNEWADITLSSGIITPKQILEYLDSGNKIIYAITARIPDSNKDIDWISELSHAVPTHIIELANKGKLHIAFFVGEILILQPPKLLEIVDEHLLKAGINKESITVYFPNFKIPELGVSHLKFISIFEMSYHLFLAESNLPLNNNIVQTVNLEPRNKKFTCLNHLNKQHRACFAASIFNANKHTDGYFSYHANPLIRGCPEEFFMNLNPYHFLGDTPFLIDTAAVDDIQDHGKVQKPFFNDAYWNFVTESFYEDGLSALTEKTFKPIANLQPFIIVGAPGSLAALHDLGYKTFNDVIDESYDYIEDPDRRMELLVQLAFRLIDMTDKQHIKMMTKIKPILEHNQQVFLNKKWEDML